ncbi:MAG TPA: HD domain-containing protein [Gemmatimonadota bacterium]|nr:HD domain-containing protein [Gemmatimonadota bacterium]
MSEPIRAVRSRAAGARLVPSAGLSVVVRRLREEGRAAFAVGGGVRDGLLGLAVDRWDVASDARPERVLELFEHSYPIGLEHGTVGVRIGDEIVEVTTFRTDVETDGRHAVVRFGATLEEDLARRDFTINAIAWDPATDEIHDPFGGLEDLAARRLITVGDPDRRLVEDYLRILRAFRFVARFDLEIEPATRAALGRHAGGVTGLSGERVRDELLKTFCQCRTPSRALEGWREAGVLARLLPEVAASFGVEQNRFHADDVGTHTLMVVDRVHRSRPFLRLVALLHDIGKPPAREVHPETGDWTFPEHAAIGARLGRQVLERLRFSAREAERAVHLVAVHMDLPPPEASDAAIRRWIRRIGEENVWDLYRLHLADWWGNRARDGEPPVRLVAIYRRARAILKEDVALSVEDLAVDGRDLIALGLEPGPAFGRILESLLERVVEDPALNRRETLLEIVREEELVPRA